MYDTFKGSVYQMVHVHMLMYTRIIFRGIIVESWRGVRRRPQRAERIEEGFVNLLAAIFIYFKYYMDPMRRLLGGSRPGFSGPTCSLSRH